MSKMRLVSILLVIILIFTYIPCSVMASSNSDPIEVTLSMYSNLSDKKHIAGLYKDNVFYIRVEDLCEISGAKIERTENNNVFLSLNQGMRNFEIITAGGGAMKEIFYSDSYDITMPVIVRDNNVYISAIDFLHYIGAYYSLSKDGNPQFMVAIKYNIFDAMADLVNSDLGNFFWWDEVDYDGKSIENKIINAGVVALINRDSNVFRMMFDAKGIEREALEDALISILTNEGASYFDENNKQLDFINLGNDVLGMESSIASFIVDFYKSDATDSFGKYLDGFASTSADAVNSITNLLNSIESVKQFERMTETQRTLLENTIISYSENSSTLNDGWENLLEAAKNVDTRAKDAYANKYAEALDFSQKTGYDMLKGSTGTNPVSIAWDGAILINKLIPYTSNMIDKKTQLYNAYNCSMIQLIANELIANAYSRLYYSNYCGQQASHLDYLTQIKNSLVLQLKSTLTTREYLIKSEFLTEDYANAMQTMNKETADLLNKAENCKVVAVGEMAIYTGNMDYNWIGEQTTVIDNTVDITDGYWENKIQSLNVYSFSKDGTGYEYLTDVTMHSIQKNELKTYRKFKYEYDGKQLRLFFEESTQPVILELVTKDASVEWDIGIEKNLPKNEEFFYEVEWNFDNDPLGNAMYLVRSNRIVDNSSSWSDSYQTLLNDYISNSTWQYSLYDIDKNTIPELIIKKDYGDYSIYTYNDNVVHISDEYWWYSNCLYSHDNGLVVYDGGKGSLHLEYIYLYVFRNGTLELEETIMSTEESSLDELRESLKTYTQIAFIPISDTTLFN